MSPITLLALLLPTPLPVDYGPSGWVERGCTRAQSCGTVADDEPSVDDLIKTLKSPDIRDRRGAARRLGEMGPKAKKAIPALVEAMKDPSTSSSADAVMTSVMRADNLNCYSAIALIKIGGDSAVRSRRLPWTVDVTRTSGCSRLAHWQRSVQQPWQRSL